MPGAAGASRNWSRSGSRPSGLLGFRARHSIKQGDRDRLRKAGASRNYAVNNTKDPGLVRFIPFRVFPEARYAALIIRFGGRTKVSVMRNPWRESDGPSLGQIAEEFGGGGHGGIGSVIVSSSEDAERVRQEMLRRVLEGG